MKKLLIWCAELFNKIFKKTSKAGKEAMDVPEIINEAEFQKRLTTIHKFDFSNIGSDLARFPKVNITVIPPGEAVPAPVSIKIDLPDPQFIGSTTFKENK